MKRLSTNICALLFTLISLHLSAQVSFTTDVTTGCAPLTVKFTNTSTSGTFYQWYFGDGNTYNGTDTSYTYYNAGNYWAELYAYDASSNYIGYHYIQISVDGSSGNFNAPDSACPNEKIYFSSYDNASSYSWNFGDGTTGSGQYADHIYSTLGTYNVSLIITTACGTDTINKAINISSTIYPLADFGFPSNACPGEEIYFNPYYSAVSHSWNFGDGTTSTSPSPNHIYNTAGTYNVSHTATNSCGNSATDVKTITIDNSMLIPSWVTMNLNSSPACPGENISFYASGGFINYTWNFGDGSPVVITGNNADVNHIYTNPGTYTSSVNFTNTCGNDTTLYYTIFIDSNLVIPSGVYFNGNSPTCPGDYIDFNASWGFKNYTWNFGDGSPVKNTSDEASISHKYTTTGTYTASVNFTNTCGNDTTLYYNITIDNSLAVSQGVYFDANPTPACPGDKIGFNASWGYNNYTWTFGDGSPTMSTANDNYVDHIYSTTGTYTASVNFKNGCGNDTTLYYTVIINNTLSLPSWISLYNYPSSTCPGDEMNFDAQGGHFSYVWNFGDGSPADSSAQNYVSHSFAATGNYTVSVKITNHCGKDTILYKTVTINNNLPVSYAYLDSYPNLVCPGEKVFFETDNGIASYAWDFGDGTTSTAENPDHAYTSVGNYLVTLTLTNGCGNDTTLYDSVSVMNNVVPNPNNYEYGTPDDATSHCPGDSIIFFFRPSGGGTYLWNFGDGNTATAMTPFEPEPGFFVDILKHAYSSTGTYKVTLTYTNLCGNSFTDSMAIQINNTSPVSGELMIDNDNVCVGGTATFAAMGGVSYLWNFGDGSANVTTTTSLSPVNHTYTTAGNYTVSVIITNGCGNKDTLMETITVAGACATPLSVSISTVNPGCSGGTGSATANAVGGGMPYSYIWSNGATTSSISGLTTGTYSVTVSDAGGNTASASVAINQSNIAIVISSTNATCGNNGSATASVTGAFGAYTYLWSNGANTSSITGLAAGTYALTVKDSLGCTKNASVTISNIPLGLTVTTTNASCNKADGLATVTVSGGSSPYSFVWTSGDTQATADSLPSGLYNVTVYDALGCEKSATATISDVGAANIAVTSVTNVNCKGGSNGAINITATGGTTPYSFEWSNGATTEDISNVPAGPYEVAVISVNGCRAMKSITINQPAAIIVTTLSTNANCNTSDGTASVNVVGGTSPYSYSWSNGASSATLSGLASGGYTITVTDTKGCTAKGTIAISEVGGATLTIDSLINPSCGDTLGSIYLSATGGSLPYTYLWSNGATTEDIINAATGTYSLVVTGANGCKSSIMSTIEYLLPARQEVCLVTVDSATGRNLIVWEKPLGATNIAGYKIYKESSSAGEYQNIGFAPYDSLSAFIDNTANPQVKAFRYKLSCVTDCNDESLWSGQEHKTIHLTINLGINNSVNLIWSHYQGFTFGSYVIHRYTDTQGWQVLDTISSADNSFSDFTVPVANELFYTVEALMGDVCTAVRAQNYNSSRSNRSQSIPSPAGTPDAIAENNGITNVNVYPNPTSGIFTLEMDATENTKVIVFDLQGKLVMAEQLISNTGRTMKQIDLSHVGKGVYHLQVISNKGMMNKKVVVN